MYTFSLVSGMPDQKVRVLVVRLMEYWNSAVGVTAWVATSKPMRTNNWVSGFVIFLRLMFFNTTVVPVTS